MEENFHVTFNEDDELIIQTSTEEDDIAFNENISFPDDEFLVPRKPPTQLARNDDALPYVSVFEPLSTNNITIPDTITSTSLRESEETPFEETNSLGSQCVEWGNGISLWTIMVESLKSFSFWEKTVKLTLDVFCGNGYGLTGFWESHT
ncbi:hypothetical protein Tco_0021631, partial [Tanacetum coccineum]